MRTIIRAAVGGALFALAATVGNAAHETPDISGGPRVAPAPEAGVQDRLAQQRVYLTGPRGGCYYINRNGNKTYVDRRHCR